MKRITADMVRTALRSWYIDPAQNTVARRNQHVADHLNAALGAEDCHSPTVTLTVALTYWEAARNACAEIADGWSDMKAGAQIAAAIRSMPPPSATVAPAQEETPKCPHCSRPAIAAEEKREWRCSECKLAWFAPSATVAPAPAKGGIASIIGKWPGDETDEEIAAALNPKPAVADAAKAEWERMSQEETR